MGFFFPVVANLPWCDHGAAPRGVAVEGVKEHSPLFSAAEYHMDITPFCCTGTGRFLHILAKAKKNPENPSKLVSGRLHFQEEI